MKLYGDVSESDRKLAEDLEILEKKVDNGAFDPESKAKMLTCLAHDYYLLDCEEEGYRLLNKAEQICPGYFKNVMHTQIMASDGFDLIVKNIALKLVSLTIGHLKDKA